MARDPAISVPSPFFWRDYNPPKFWRAQIIRDQTTLYNAARIFSVLAVVAPVFVPAAGPLGEAVAESLDFSTRESLQPLQCSTLPELSQRVAACSVCAHLSS